MKPASQALIPGPSPAGRRVKRSYRGDDLARPGGFDDGVGNTQVLQTVARADQRLGLTADHRGEVLDLLGQGILALEF